MNDKTKLGNTASLEARRALLKLADQAHAGDVDEDINDATVARVVNSIVGAASWEAGDTVTRAINSHLGQLTA